MKKVVLGVGLIVMMLLASFVTEGGIEYKKRTLVKGVSMELPITFTPMDTSDLIMHFPAYRLPMAAYKGPNNKVAFGFNVMRTPWDGELSLLKDFYKSNLYRTFDKVKIYKDTIITYKKREFAILAFDSKVRDLSGGPSKKMYHYMAYTIEPVSEQSRVFLFNFQMPFSMKERFAASCEYAVSTTKIKKIKQETINQSAFKPASPTMTPKKDPGKVKDQIKFD